VPFYGFKGYNAPKNIPEEIKVAILDLEASSHDQLSYLQNAYSLILDKNLHQWQHTRFQAVFKVPQAFITDLSELWSIKKFIYCTGINYVLLTLLVGSKYFKAEDIKTRHVFLNFITHQYLQVRVNEKWIDADPAGSGIRGRGLGTHASFFG
jgi:hypothetical protein